MSLPQLSQIIGSVTGDLNQGGLPLSVQAQFNKARGGIESDYTTQSRTNQAAITQGFAQAGGIYNTGQVSDTMKNAAQNLDIERRNAMRRLDFQEAEAGLTQYNALMNLLGSGAGAALNLGSGFSGAQAQAIGGLSGQSSGGGAVAGGISGAGLGYTVGGPYGAVAGGLLGALGGFYGAGG